MYSFQIPLLIAGGFTLSVVTERAVVARARSAHVSNGGTLGAQTLWPSSSFWAVLTCTLWFVVVGVLAESVLAATAAAMLVVAARTDLLYRVVPNQVVGVGIALALIVRVLGGLPILQPTLAATVAALALLGVRVAGQWSKGRPGMGMGDVKLAAALGLLMGWNAMWSLYLGAAFVALFGVVHWVTGRPLPLEVPFAPFIAVGWAAAWVLPFSTVFSFWDLM